MNYYVLFGTALIMILWYTIRKKLKKPLMGYERQNAQAYANAVILVTFAAVITISFTLFHIFTQDNQDDFMVSSGICFAVILAILGLVLSILYKLIIKSINKKYKKKFRDDSDPVDIQVPIDIYFDMGIIIAGVIAYKIGVDAMVGLCASVIVGEYLGPATLIEKKEKEKTFFSKLMEVPFWAYILFFVMIAVCLFDIGLDIVIPFIIGILICTMYMLFAETMSYKNGAGSEFYEKDYGARKPTNYTRPEDLELTPYVGSSWTDTVRILRAENDIRIIKDDNTCRPIHSIPEIIEFVKLLGVFEAVSKWWVPGTDKFEKKYNAAKGTYAQSAPKNEVILIHDDTVGGSAKRGLVLTGTKLYQRSVLERDFICDLEHIKRIFVDKTPYSLGMYSIYIYVDGVDKEILSVFKYELNKYFNALYEIIAFIYGYKD